MLFISLTICSSSATAEPPKSSSTVNADDIFSGDAPKTPTQTTQPPKRGTIVDIDEQFPDEKPEASLQAPLPSLPAKEQTKKPAAELNPEGAEAARKLIERLYQMPEGFIEPTDTKQEQQTPQPQVQTQTTTPKPKQPTTTPAKPAEPKSFFEKALEFIFGSDQNPQAAPRRPISIPAEEFEKNEINFKAIEEIKDSIKNVEAVQGLKPLEKIVRSAIKSSPEVAKARMELQIVKQQNTFMPTPTFYVGNNPTTAKSNMGIALNLSLEPLFTGKSRQRHAELSVIQTEIMVAQRVIEQYRLILNISKKLANRQGKQRYIGQLVANVREQYKGGLIKIDELIKGEELKWNVDLEEETLKLDLQTAIERLNALESGGK